MSSENNNGLSVREYDPKRDAEMVSEWWKAHTGGTLPLAMLSPVGVVVERRGRAVAALWMYLAVGVGVAWIEYAITPPRQSMALSRQALCHAMRALEQIALVHDYGVAVVYTCPAVARYTGQLGYKPEGKRVAVSKVLRKEESHVRS